MKTTIVPTLLSVLLLGWSAMPLAENSQSDMLGMLDQLDQLDRADFDSAITAIYDCSERKNFSCADKKIEAARSLISNPDDKEQLRDAKQYRQKTYQYAKAEERQLARIERQETCASRCPVANEYNRCVAGRLSAQHCSSGSASGYTPSSNLDFLNSALQQLNKHATNYFQQKQQLLRQQQAAYEQQRRQKQRQQRLIAQQKRDWEQAQVQQQRRNQQRETELAALRAEQQNMRQQAEQRRQKANAPKVSQSNENPAKPALTGEILTWKNKAGKWWSCGPIQCIWSSYDTEKEVIALVIDGNRMTYSYNGPVGKCRSYTVTGLESYDASREMVRKQAKCF